MSRHPAVVRWTEIARVLSPGGTYFAQHVGPASVFELTERIRRDGAFVAHSSRVLIEARKPAG